MLNPNAQKWVDALRSGKFKQAKKQLYYRGAYCCLGVACVLAEKEGIHIDSEWRKDNLLPDEVRDWLGLTSESGRYFLNDFLTNDNDAPGSSFKSIAQIIELAPAGLFK